MTDHGGIFEASREELQGDMIFSMDPLEAFRLTKEKDDPMWSSSLSRETDWFLSEE